MRSLFVWICFVVFLVSCQTTSESPEVANEVEEATPIKAPVVPATIPHKKTARKKMSLTTERSKKMFAKPEVRKLPPNTISNCPAGINGSLVGPIENGKHCFTNQPEANGKCLANEDDQVRQKAEGYCGKLKGHWKRKGLWKFGPQSDLRVEKMKRYSCQCGTWRGKPLCKSFFEFNCETVETR